MKNENKKIFYLTKKAFIWYFFFKNKNKKQYNKLYIYRMVKITFIIPLKKANKQTLLYAFMMDIAKVWKFQIKIIKWSDINHLINNLTSI